MHRAEDAAHQAAHVQALADPAIDLVAFERDKVKGAIRTDFILSAEIIVISLGTVATASLMNQFAVLAGVSAIMTVGVYGLVAGIVKLDDAGMHLSRKASASAQALGRGLLVIAPRLMKTLSVVGTAAMFMVGGSILSHGVPLLHHGIADASAAVATVPALGGVLSAAAPTLLDAVVGVVAGGLVLLGVSAAKRLLKRD